MVQVIFVYSKSKIMRKLTVFIILSVLLLTSVSCRRTSHNGKIDGFWKIMEIQYDENSTVATSASLDGQSVIPNNRFICINLELIQFGNPEPEITGIIAYDKSGRTLGIEFPGNPGQRYLLNYGVAGNPVSLDIVTLTEKRLVLKSSVATITCRRF